MENEIELKIMLLPKNIPFIIDWLNQQKIIKQGKNFLGNTYYDSDEKYFAENKMGLRVRRKNQQYEITLKMKGEIVGGLHIRPEYNLPLENDKIDFPKLVKHYQLDFSDEILNAELLPVFSTDFERQTWLIQFNQSEIEVVLDQGLIKNPFGEEAICEVEFELKQGKLADIFALLDQMPKRDGMWLSSLSKAQRGYLVGRTEYFADFYQDLTPCKWENLSEIEKYQFLQKLADLIRSQPKEEWIKKYTELAKITVDNISFFTSKIYLDQNIKRIKSIII